MRAAVRNGRPQGQMFSDGRGGVTAAGSRHSQRFVTEEMGVPVKPRRPCGRCGRLTPFDQLVETHMPTRKVRQSWLLSADRVVWMCRGCVPRRRS